MSGRRKSPKIDGGCGAALLVVGAVVTPIAYALEFIFKNIGIIILSLAIVSVCVGIVFLFRSLFQQRKNRQEKRRRYEIIAQAPEKAPTLFPISDDPVFANPEEEWLNRDFRAFLRRKMRSFRPVPIWDIWKVRRRPCTFWDEVKRPDNSAKALPRHAMPLQKCRAREISHSIPGIVPAFTVHRKSNRPIRLFWRTFPMKG